MFDLLVVRKCLVKLLSPPIGKMSAMRRGSSSTRRTARVAAAPYPVHQYQQDSTSSDSPARPRSIASTGSTGSWQLTPASGEISAPAFAPQLPQQGGSSSSGCNPHLHLHRTEVCRYPPRLTDPVFPLVKKCCHSIIQWKGLSAT